jgi:hypothetical protein
MPRKWQPTQILRYVKTIPTSTNVAIVDTVPRDARTALAELVLARANYVAENMVVWLWPAKEQQNFGFLDESESES